MKKVGFTRLLTCGCATERATEMVNRKPVRAPDSKLGLGIAKAASHGDKINIQPQLGARRAREMRLA